RIILILLYNQMFQPQIEQVIMNFIRQNISCEGENIWGKIRIIKPPIWYSENGRFTSRQKEGNPSGLPRRMNSIVIRIL
ncbi:MAG: hypothetical protein ACOCWY_04370, partial [Thermodesulfobacteriota bacterium]